MDKSKNGKKLINGILLFGVMLRFIVFVVNLFVEGRFIDESMLSLNANALAQHGTDIFGNSYPIYFATWIYGGQSPLATYICALSIKLFGSSLFALRLPMLIVGIIGLFGFYALAKRIFDDNNKLVIIAISLAAISPWMLFSSAYVLDCNLLGYCLIFGVLFLIKAQDTNKIIHFVLSMLFFALGFYSYIASVLIIPVFLAVMYLYLIIKRGISIKGVLASVFSLVLFSIPFIVFGLVSVGVLDDFTLGGVFFGGMGEYQRGSSVALADGGVLAMLGNLAGAVGISLLPEVSAIFGNSVNHFAYGGVLSGALMLAGVVYAIKLIIKKRISNVSCALILASLAAILCFFIMTNESYADYLYRYQVMSAFFIMYEGVGFYAIAKKMPKLKHSLVAYLAVNMAFFIGVFALVYVPETKDSIDLYYGDSVSKCVQYVDESEPQHIGFLCVHPIELRRSSIYLRDYYGDDNFISYYDESTKFSCDDVTRLSGSDYIEYYKLTSDLTLTEDYYILAKITATKLDSFDGYKLIDFGSYCVLEKVK